MTCGLSLPQLAVLKYLVEKRCVRVDAAKRYEAIMRDFAGKGIDVDEVLESLLGSYISKTKKQAKIHYYVGNLGETLHVLKAHGLWEPGRIHKLQTQ